MSGVVRLKRWVPGLAGVLAMLTVLGYDPAVRLETVDGVEIVPLDAPFARS